MTNRLDLTSVIVTFVSVGITIALYFNNIAHTEEMGALLFVMWGGWFIIAVFSLMMVLGCIVKFFGLTQGDLEAIAPKH